MITSSHAQVRIPEHFVLPALHKLQKSHGYDPDSVAWVYTVAMSTLMGTLAGVVQSIMGSPGDLPETIAAIHEKARLQMQICCSTPLTIRGSSPSPGMRNYRLAHRPKYPALRLLLYAMTTCVEASSRDQAAHTSSIGRLCAMVERGGSSARRATCPSASRRPCSCAAASA